MQTLDRAIGIATKVLAPEHVPYRDVRVPAPAGTNGNGQMLEVPAVWTRDMLRPRWDNLSTFVVRAQSDKDIYVWESASTDLDVGLILLARDDFCTLVSPGTSGVIVEPEISYDELPNELEQRRRRLFLPSVLAAKRGGQLSFADLDNVLSTDLPYDSLAFQSRHRKDLETALKDALERAIATQVNSYSVNVDTVSPTQNTSDPYSIQSVVAVTIAYLGARILADKNYFGSPYSRIDDPRDLLHKTIKKTNGFFDTAYKEHLPNLSEYALQALASHIGSSVTFALVDHSDVGRLYEQAVLAVPDLIRHLNELSILGVLRTLPNLQQHYTPVAVADLMLEHLPLERLRPEERVIYDPAAGSGSLLLAATKRLALMPDISNTERANILATQIMGNDLDVNARLITRLRYIVAGETLGLPDIFPEPAFLNEDYMNERAWQNLPKKPRVVVGNPPFIQQQVESAEHSAVQFMKTVLKRIDEGSQFAVVLPDAFLTGSKYGWRKLRETLSSQCQILETWQLPEGAVGLSAEQAVSVVLGVKGEPTSKNDFISRATITRAGIKKAVDEGFLGDRWLTSVGVKSADWSSALRPIPLTEQPTLQLGLLFHTCVGVTPRKGAKAISHPLPGIPTKPYWQQSWKKRDSLWANPDNVRPGERYIRYTSEFLAGLNRRNEKVFDSSKIMVNHGSNRATVDPLGACLDTVGLCPDKNTICIIPHTKMPNRPELNEWPYLQAWLALSVEDKLLWLLGILASEIGRELATYNRAPRYLTLPNLRQFKLPARIDQSVIDLARQIVNLDRRTGILNRHVEERRTLVKKLNNAVNESYGNLSVHESQRTGYSIELAARRKERANRTFTVIGRVSKYDIPNQRIELYIDALSDEKTVKSSWIPSPAELPGWALDGTVFEADISRDVRTFDELSTRPWALRNFRHTPRPYISLDELKQRFLKLSTATHE